MRFLIFGGCGFECYTYFYLEIGIRILFGGNLYLLILILIFDFWE